MSPAGPSATPAIDPSEVQVTAVRAQGAGGQNVNKVETGVRLRHKPSGIVIENTETRSQLQNKEKAMALLMAKLLVIAQEQRAAEIVEKNRELTALNDKLNEAVEQLEKLRNEGCIEIQGYLISPPRPASEIPGLVARYSSGSPIEEKPFEKLDKPQLRAVAG